ncbi:GreA/GreB family elongation factor [Pseudonocardia acaciae]|uniref:GreA/GreB family elongation factor n=1 Tax=Pseudonocardia acaciae TaxID=551276 RepID=UPI000490E5F2|nr:GreA/GreB family elongation factor [Pseudonocardia acaciae]
MTHTQPTWLSHGAHERLKAELADLVRQQTGSSNEDGQRIRKPRAILRDSSVGAEPPDDGVAEPGMLVTIRYADDPDTETFLLADREEGVHLDIEVCSPSSPLGAALTGVREGEHCEYALPNGETMTVTVISAVRFVTR